ncbi:MAG: hypothetical protein JSW07_21575 [bacterium]|nr:MAG: hypothetical protein JSW07_21575 [bacterium]
MLNRIFKEKVASKRKEEKSITLSEILRGITAGRMQSVGIMQVIPLISELQDERFISPAEAEFSTSAYGTMVFDNPSEAILLVPAHAGYVLKQRVQDHAMSHAGIVRPRRKRTFNTAICLQETQAGLVPPGHYEMMILPFSLREIALNKRREKKYSKLWDVISKFNAKFGLKATGHLDTFLEHFKKELDEFVAEFECVPRQVGAIILINGEVVGVERTPSHQYWKSIWTALIRECYGSLAIQIARAKGQDIFPLKTRVSLSEDVKSLEELLEAIETARQQEEEIAKAIIRELLDKSFDIQKEEKDRGLVVETLSSDRFMGQMIRDDERIVYASLIASDKWIKKREWTEAKPFEI